MQLDLLLDGRFFLFHLLDLIGKLLPLIQKSMQKFVGGLIECITLSDTGSEITLVCNDEGKLLGLPLNRPLWDGADVLAGPGFLAGCDNEGNLTSLPQSAMDYYKETFRAFIIEI